MSEGRSSKPGRALFWSAAVLLIVSAVTFSLVLNQALPGELGFVSIVVFLVGVWCARGWAKLRWTRARAAAARAGFYDAARK